jgi:predicted membrane channel-forming protein YqfA (hemolysin III family)
MNKKIKAGIYTTLVFLLVGLVATIAYTYPRTFGIVMLYSFLVIALGGVVYSVYNLIYLYLDDKEEDPFIF